MSKWIRKEVEVEISFDDIKDKEFLEEIFAHSTQTIATAINTIAENGSESKFNELFYSLGDTAKEKLSELLIYYANIQNKRI
ncbi:hypothetical protein [Campylobacter sp. CN_NA1]|uniref:hypothetical protein n=1 Tax=Campylobacter sp. CN_NA1 TaxID=2984150 RepID=UPI0022E9F871|nr:hypothetical protein [Campylobacter sp. CN_NA1]MDA3056456.1 hypothetical protein [Campylobacter sp. CN_NA1]